jgi:hypothetical protein
MRETSEPNEDPTSDVEQNIRELVHRDGSSLRRQPESETDLVAGSIGSLLQRVSGSSVQEIDRLIGELQALREILNQQGMRVQQKVMDYASMSQAALQSTRIIAESLARWKGVPDAPRIGE